jgi:hypothetical protein
LRICCHYFFPKHVLSANPRVNSSLLLEDVSTASATQTRVLGALPKAILRAPPHKRVIASLTMGATNNEVKRFRKVFPY